MTVSNDNRTATGIPRRCLLTGGTGYVGSRIRQQLQSQGWQVTELSRKPATAAGAIRHHLGDAIAPEKLSGHVALVHCAYDFRPVSWKEISAINVRGSELLLRAARQAGVRQLVFISSISAYEGCRSLYGQAKLEIERVTQSLGGWSLRPGLIFGAAAGGMFGRLVEQVRQSKFIALPGRGRQRQYLVHETDLCSAVSRCVRPDLEPWQEPVTLAQERAWTLRELLLEIARGLERRIVFVPVPWQLVWAGLRLGEKLRLPLKFRSDSLVSLVHQNPKPGFNSLEALGVNCRPFEFRGLSVANTPTKAKDS